MTLPPTLAHPPSRTHTALLAAALCAVVSALMQLPEQAAPLNGYVESTHLAHARLMSGARWVWPLDPVPEIVHRFDPPDDPWGPGNRGVDLLGSPAQPVLAIAAGEVTFARPLAGRGVVVVSHGALRSTYEPVTADVVVGDRVEAGSVIGLLQTVQSHCAPQFCLHLGLRRGERYLDPLSMLGPQPVRLKPLLTASVPAARSDHEPMGRFATSDPQAVPRRDASSTGSRSSSKSVASGVRQAVAAVVLSWSGADESGQARG